MSDPAGDHPVAAPDPGGPPAWDTEARRTVAIATGLQIVGILPFLLTGALAVQIRAELQFSAPALGVATASFVLARAVSALPLGRITDRLGARRTMQLSAAGGAIVAVSIATVVRTWAALVVALAVAGMVQALSQPAANRFLSRRMPPGRLGMAFGLKQAGPSLTAMLGGIAVPAVALTVGWRWVFVGGAALAVVTLLAVPRQDALARAARAPESAAGPVEGRSLGMLAFGFAFAIAATNCLNTFVVEGAVDAGIAPGPAGLLLAGGGLVAIVTRIYAGHRADLRGGGHLRVVAWMLGAGAVSYVLLGLHRPVVVAVGALLAYASTWSISGLFYLALVQYNPGSPGKATGTVVAGASIGGFAGPPIFGLVVEAWGYPAAWLMVAAWILISAWMIGWAHRSLSGRLAGPAPEGAEPDPVS